MWLSLFGVFFSVVLGCHGLCLNVLLICTTISGPLIDQECCSVKNSVYVPPLVFMEVNG